MWQKIFTNSPNFGAELSKKSHFKEDLLKLKSSTGTPARKHGGNF